MLDHSWLDTNELLMELLLVSRQHEVKWLSFLKFGYINPI